MYATPVKTTTANSQSEIEYDNTLTVTQKSSQEGYDVAAPHITHSTARTPKSRHNDSAEVSSVIETHKLCHDIKIYCSYCCAFQSLQYAELQFGNNPVGPAVPSSAAVTYTSIKT